MAILHEAKDGDKIRIRSRKHKSLFLKMAARLAPGKQLIVVISPRPTRPGRGRPTVRKGIGKYG